MRGRLSRGLRFDLPMCVWLFTARMCERVLISSLQVHLIIVKTFKVFSTFKENAQQIMAAGAAELLVTLLTEDFTNDVPLMHSPAHTTLHTRLLITSMCAALLLPSRRFHCAGEAHSRLTTGGRSHTRAALELSRI